jgi:hypothetical protein
MLEEVEVQRFRVLGIWRSKANILSLNLCVRCMGVLYALERLRVYRPHFPNTAPDKATSLIVTLSSHACDKLVVEALVWINYLIAT